MYMYIYIYMYTYIYLYIHVCTQVYVYVYVHTYVCIYIYICAYIRICILVLYFVRKQTKESAWRQSQPSTAGPMRCARELADTIADLRVNADINNMIVVFIVCWLNKNT